LRRIARPSERPRAGSALGRCVREHADRYQGATLACLVAADRHDHLATEVIPRLDTGVTVICDRYVASTLVVQRLDGVPQQYLLDLNTGMRMPDLAVILAADPPSIAARIAHRGATHRFHRDSSFPARETALYRETVSVLRGMGGSVLVVDTGSAPPAEVARRIATAAFGGLDKVPRHPGSPPTQGATPQ
jgi:dTMP kinase